MLAPHTKLVKEIFGMKATPQTQKQPVLTEVEEGGNCRTVSRGGEKTCKASDMFKYLKKNMNKYFTSLM